MIVLALDTSTSIAAMALVEDGRTLCEESLDAGKKRGEIMAGIAAKMLDKLGKKPADLDAYVIGLGPGSFTGLRSGLAFIKGLHIANPRPLIGVSTLHAMVMNAENWSGPVLPLIDAKKGEVFTAVFHADETGAIERRSEDMAIDPEKVAGLVAGDALLLGDGLVRYGELIKNSLGGRAKIAEQKLWHPRAANLAALARPRLEKGESDPVDSLVPIYIRASDSELKLGPKK